MALQCFLHLGLSAFYDSPPTTTTKPSVPSKLG
uniref:Uncharacterized protein n=1 Tax=Arundo donax TaxID=35708 RepID=A0A0A9DVU1_ARUDO